MRLLMWFRCGSATLALWFLARAAADEIETVQTHIWPGQRDSNYHGMAGDLMNVSASEWALADWCCFEKAKTENGDSGCCVSEADDQYENMYVDDKDRHRCPHAGYTKRRSSEWDRRRRRLRVAPEPPPEARAARELGHCCDTSHYCKCMERMLVDGGLKTDECALPCEYRTGKRNPRLFRVFLSIAITCGVIALCCLKNSGRLEEEDQALWRLVSSMNGFMACSHFSGFASALIGGGLLAAYNGEYPEACKLVLHNFGTMFLMLGCVIEFSIFALAAMIGVMTIQKRADARKIEKERVETEKRLLREKAEQPGSMRVWIKMLSGETCPLQVEPHDTYEVLAERVHIKIGIAPEMQRLMSQHKDLGSCKTRTLEEHGVKDGTAISVLVVHDNERNAGARVHPIVEPEEKQEVTPRVEELGEDARALP